MDEEEPSKKENFRHQAIKKEARKLKARQKNGVNAWWGFSLFGLIGWSVALPALIGVFIGLWLTHHYACSNTVTLVLLLAGIIVGCVCALILVARELFNKKDE